MRALVAVVALAACGPQYPSVEGAWSYTDSVSNGSGFSCQNTLTLVLSQSGPGFQGSYAGTELCNGNNTPAQVDGTVTSGVVTSADAVSFDFDNTNDSHDGTAAGASMGGTTTVTIPNAAVLTGSWSAAHQ